MLPGLDHLFVVDADGFPGDYGQLPAPVVVQPAAPGIMVDWLATRLR